MAVDLRSAEPLTCHLTKASVTGLAYTLELLKPYSLKIASRSSSEYATCWYQTLSMGRTSRSKRVTMPKLGPPPLRAQKRSEFWRLLALTTDPSPRTT